MKPARRAISAILIALMFGIVSPNLYAFAAEHPTQPESATIGRATVPSSVELATETLTIRQVPSTRVERHRPESIGLPPRIAATHLRRGRVATSAPHAAVTAVASAVTRGRAPPL